MIDNAASTGNNQTTFLYNLVLDEKIQEQVLTAARQFKNSAVSAAKQKKEIMRRCYAYSKNKLYDGDLLPIFSTDGGDRDMKTTRPQVFMPVTRQNLKNLWSQLLLTIFPNDDDFMRVRAKTAAGVVLEESLSQALSYLFRQSRIAQKIGGCIFDCAWSGSFSAYPCIKQRTVMEYRIEPIPVQVAEDENTNANDLSLQQFQLAYVPYEIKLPPEPDVEAWNPLNFYVDIEETNPEFQRWVYLGKVKKNQLLDNPEMMNTEKVRELSGNGADNSASRMSLNVFNDIQGTSGDMDASLDYDLYYFPHLKTETQLFRNIIVGIVNDKVLVRFHPNLFPRGLNPVVFGGWLHDPRTPYSQGPAEDMIDLQRLINLLQNYKIEALARNDNRWVMSPNANIDNYNGVVGGIIITENPQTDVIHINGGYEQMPVITNEVGVLKAEAQTVAGSQNPFQGSSNIDYQKTATEINLLQEQYITITRQVIENLSVYVRGILERLAFLLADTSSEPIEVPVDLPNGLRQFITVDLSPLKSGDFTIELVGVNPSQSKAAQVNGLIQLLQLVSSDPDSVFTAEPIIKKIAELQGIKNIDQILSEIKQSMIAQEQLKQTAASIVTQRVRSAVANSDSFTKDTEPPKDEITTLDGQESAPNLVKGSDDDKSDE
ncbi:MAG: hypothetical protein K2X01_05275 [Cyanobacteria bacterium]|nr:hypothetical protein [Cyanobacteriota bacterium]